MDGSQGTSADAGRLMTAKDVAALLAVPTSWVYAQSRRRDDEMPAKCPYGFPPRDDLGLNESFHVEKR